MYWSYYVVLVQQYVTGTEAWKTIHKQVRLVRRDAACFAARGRRIGSLSNKLESRGSTSSDVGTCPPLSSCVAPEGDLPACRWR